MLVFANVTRGPQPEQEVTSMPCCHIVPKFSKSAGANIMTYHDIDVNDVRMSKARQANHPRGPETPEVSGHASQSACVACVAGIACVACVSGLAGSARGCDAFGRALMALI